MIFFKKAKMSLFRGSMINYIENSRRFSDKLLKWKESQANVLDIIHTLISTILCYWLNH